MDNKKLLSLIIPVYNADKYLELCLSSVFSQWDNMLEVIIINDGSTDNSSNIINNYSNKFDFLYVNQENTGIAAVRNKGVDASSGKYISFLDSDDIWCDGIYNSIKKIVLDNSPDGIVFNYSEVIDNQEKKIELIKENNYITNGLNSVKVKIAKSEIFYAWRYIFKQSIFNGMNFDIGRRFEDQLLLPILIDKCKSIYECKEFIVKYRQISSSITKNLNVSDLDDSEFGLVRFRDKYSTYKNKYWAVVLASVFLSHVSKCARIYHFNKTRALDSYNKSYTIVSLKPIIHSGKLKPILYYMVKDKLFFRLISSVEKEVRK
ncbi:glycosyltransferase family 2 protein [Yersinia kristensenii]|uniref:glycosyltransferase family 2 protein n=1 Tax=Yersinia kristensenii TaxID=28152 RepID=UPI0005E737EB|nr:glycosyltransferase [Yersinia kristensenii]MDA5475133.1 glycosyltransferase [Yersinia kristensenii]MDA5478696.1 glycosyltransferase [Yersinia kristensenii]MDA5507143.1 glycosyltransferase [Yersinia kristensenii]MDA5523238.1 glycosyltransferase [Yersinia kristensenii]MDX6735785.1 glycosyltransferase [Yersinia kristensenii]